MLDQKVNFIGVTINPSNASFSATVLDGGLRLLGFHSGSQEETLAVCLNGPAAVTALNFPMRPNQGIVKGLHARRSGPGRPALHDGDMRLCERTIKRRGLKIPGTPTDPAQCLEWMRQGFDFYQSLQSAGYQTLSTPDASFRMLETQSEVVFQLLLEHPLLPSRTLEGHLQRHLILYERAKMRIANPMDFFEEITAHRLLQGNWPMGSLYSLPELNGMACAYMAWLAANRPQQVSQVGDEGEGCLVLPFWKELEAEKLPAEAQQIPMFVE